MFKEFKDFALKGNVLDMAVGIIIGAAFGTIVTSFVNDMVMPVVGLWTGGVDFSQKFLVLSAGAAPGPYATVELAKEAGAVTMNWGLFVNAVFAFLIVAFTLFMIVRSFNKAKQAMAAKAKAEEAAAPPPAPSAQEVLLAEIRDLLAKT